MDSPLRPLAPLFMGKKTATNKEKTFKKIFFPKFSKFLYKNLNTTDQIYCFYDNILRNNFHTKIGFTKGMTWCGEIIKIF